MTSSNSGQCGFCGEDFSNKPTPVLFAFGSPSDDPGTCTKLKPLRWQFLTNKSPCTKFMCTTCAEERQVPQQAERPHEVRDPDRKHVRKLHQREERGFDQPRSSGSATRFEHMEPQEKAHHQRRIQNMSHNAQGQRLTVYEPPSKCCDSRKDTREPQTRDGRRQSTQTSELQQEAAHRCSLQQQYTIHHVSKESVMSNRRVSAIEVKTQPSTTQHRTSARTSSRRSKPSGGQPEPCRWEHQDLRIRTTAMSRALELPLDYFDMSSSSPRFSAMTPLEQDALDCRQQPSRFTETRQCRRRATTALPQVELRKQDETEEERERRRSASYTRMLLRMYHYYDAVQMNRSQACPTTASPRRIRTKRQGKSTVVHDVKDDPTKFAIDLDYLNAYKDAR